MNIVKKTYNVTFDGNCWTQIAVDVALNHDAPTVGKPTEQTPDTFSIVDMTEKVIELEVVNNVLLPR